MTKTGRKANGTIKALDIQVIDGPEAAKLLSNVKRNGIYRPYIPYVIEAIKKLEKDQSIKFHVPQIIGRTVEENCKRLMSVINIALKHLKINHRLRHIQDSELLVSERVEW